MSSLRARFQEHTYAVSWAEKPTCKVQRTKIHWLPSVLASQLCVFIVFILYLFLAFSVTCASFLLSIYFSSWLLMRKKLKKKYRTNENGKMTLRDRNNVDKRAEVSKDGISIKINENIENKWKMCFIAKWLLSSFFSATHKRFDQVQ